MHIAYTYNELEMPWENSHQLAVIKLLYMYAYNICIMNIYLNMVLTPYFLNFSGLERFNWFNKAMFSSPVSTITLLSPLHIWQKIIK